MSDSVSRRQTRAHSRAPNSGSLLGICVDLASAWLTRPIERIGGGASLTQPYSALLSLTQPYSALLIAESTQHPVAMRWLLLLNRHDGDRKTSRGRHSKGDGIEIREGHDLAPLLDRSPSKAPVTYH